MITHESSLDNFTEQFDYVLENYSSHGLNVDSFDQIVLGGLGGSGIGALIIKTWFFNKSPIPIESIADYHLPKYVGSKTLVVLNSYSGNTEETLSMHAEAKKAGATIIILTGGGKLGAIAEANNYKVYKLKGGFQPRMTIGFGLSLLTMILGELFGNDQRNVIEDVRDHIKTNRDRLKESAEQIFQFFSRSPLKKFVIVSDRQYAPIALRFTQQLQENSKLEAFVSILPEANHNEIESYTHKMDTNFIMLYSNQNERIAARFDFLISHLELENNKILPLFIPDYSIKSIYDIIYRLDWASVLFANELGSDLMNVPIIMNLKGFLSDLEIIATEEDK